MKPSQAGTIARRCVLVLLVAQAPAAFAVSEAQLLAAAQRDLPIDLIADAEARTIRAQGARASMWLNPVLTWQHEQSFSATPNNPATSEDYAGIEQALDILGRKSLIARVFDARGDAARLEAEERHEAVLAAVRTRFFDAVHAREFAVVLANTHAALAAAREAVSARRNAGDASSYELARIDSQLASLEAEVARVRAHRKSVAAALFALLPSLEPGEIEGPLLPANLPAHEPLSPAALDALIAKTPLMRAHARAREGAEFERRAAARFILPELTLGAGFKTVQAQGARTNGFFFTISVPLGLIDRQQDLRLSAEAAKQRADAAQAWTMASLRADTRSLVSEEAELRAALSGLDSRLASRPRPLTAMAEASYRAGETNLTDLIDAHRSAVDEQRARLELALTIRRARIELDRLLHRSGAHPESVRP